MIFLAQTELAAGRKIDDLSPVMPAEKRAIVELMRKGTIKSAHLRTDRFGGVLFIEAESAEVAREVLHGLPAYVAGVITSGELIPLQIPDLSE